MKKIDLQVCNRERAEAYPFQKDQAVISIYTPGDTPANIQHPNAARVLQLRFHDVTDERMAKRLDAAEVILPINVFSDAQAKEVIAFVERMIEEGITEFTVHCDAGISRSCGVAAALNLIFNDEKDIPRGWALYNNWVYTKMLKAAGMDPLPRPDRFAL
jgi:predicted protein tyrosine phosphatase